MNGDPMAFEEPILQIRRQIEEVSAADGDPMRLAELQEKLTKVADEIYANLTPWQKTLVARHPQRPYTLDFVAALFDEWIEIHGDRNFADDAAIVAGFARFRGQACAIVGHQKGRNTKEKIVRNFGQPRPEGFRKALRVMKLAEKFKVPIFSFVDTQGAYPGVGDRVYMLEHAVYSVISPEGCAAILWKNPAAAADAAAAMRITAKDLKKFAIIDDIVPEPAGGAHADGTKAAELLGPYLEKGLAELKKVKPSLLPEERYKKFRKMGVFEKG